jgi:hypothetical protein
MSKTTLSLAFLAFLAAAPALHADTYNYIINAGAANGDPSQTLNVSGTFTGPTDPYNSAATDVNAITGSASTYNFVGVVDPGTTNTQTTATYNGLTFDNVIYPGSGSHADANGLLLYLDSPAGTSLAHVYYNTTSGYQVDVYDPNEPGATTPFGIDANSFAVSRFSLVRASAPPPSPVPEPSTWMLLGTGFAFAAGFVTRRTLTAV